MLETINLVGLAAPIFGVPVLFIVLAHIFGR